MSGIEALLLALAWRAVGLPACALDLYMLAASSSDRRVRVTALVCGDMLARGLGQRSTGSAFRLAARAEDPKLLWDTARAQSRLRRLRAIRLCEFGSLDVHTGAVEDERQWVVWGGRAFDSGVRARSVRPVFRGAFH